MDHTSYHVSVLKIDLDGCLDGAYMLQLEPRR